MSGTLSLSVADDCKQWDQIEELHRECFANRDRDKLSLRKQFLKLAKKKTPTGDPDCPADVRLAKQLLRTIQQTADAQEDMNLDDSTLGVAAAEPAEVPENAQETASVAGSAARPLAAPRGTSRRSNSASAIDVALQLMATSQANREEDRRIQMQQSQQFNNMLMQLGMVVAERLLPGVSDRVQQLVAANAAAPAAGPADAGAANGSSPAARRLSGELRAASENSVSSPSDDSDVEWKFHSEQAIQPCDGKLEFE